MKKILITGAYGFVGTNISQYLSDKECLLSALDQVRDDKNKNYTEFYSWKEFDKIPFNQFDTIIHLAGKAHDTKNKSQSNIYFEINTELTKKVFDAFLNSDAGQFMFFSSVKAAADQVDGEFLTEDVIPNPVGPYGESKIAAEQYMLSTFNFQLSTKNVYIFRPCMIHGPGNKGNLNLLYNVVSKGFPWPLGDFDNQRSFLNIWNLSWIIAEFIDKKPESGIYHLADDQPVSTNQLIELIAESRGTQAKIWKWNKDVIKNMAKIGDWCKLPLNSQRLRKLTENYVVSNQKLKKSLCISNLPVNCKDGLKRTLQTFR